MDRLIVQVGALPLDTDLLNTNKNALIALGMALQAILGPGPFVDGLNCTAGPGGLQVSVAAGAIYSVANIDATAYGSLPADTTHQIVKQGIVLDPTVFSLTPPGTAGQSQVFLIEGQYQEPDANPVSLYYFNSANPTQPLPGAATNTVRKGILAFQVKAGVAAATGSQVAPAPDAGWVPLWTVTLANGQITIVGGNIGKAANAPFITNKAGALGACALENIGLGLKDDGAGNLTLKLADTSIRVTANGVQANEPVSVVNTNQAIHAANHFSNYTCTNGINFTLDQASTLWNGFCFSVAARTGTTTVTPFATDGIGGAGAGAPYTLTPGSSALFVVDNTGNWSVFYPVTPISLSPSQAVDLGYQLGILL